MSAITPQTELRLIKCPIESDNRNQLTFSNATNQYNYFNSLPHITADNFTYQRKDNLIRYPAHIDTILTYNYVMYQNEAYTNKWFYAFITDMEYVNDNMTLITIKTDVYQTWAFDIVWKKSFVEREHVNSDNYGEHTIPENLETGEYINMYGFDSLAMGNCHIVMGTTISPINGTSPVTGGKYGGVYSGVKYFLFDSDNSVNNALQRIAGEGNSNSVVSLFIAPDWLTGYDSATFDSNGIAEIEITNYQTIGGGIAIPLRPAQCGGYTFKNKKLATYPYMAYIVSNNSGESVEYHLENFKDNTDHSGELELWGCVTPGCSIRLVPKDYKSINDLSPEYNNEYGINAGKYPICSWGNDTYTNWLTQNGVNFFGTKINANDWGTIGATASATLGIAKMYMGDTNGVNDVVGGFTGIFNVMQQDYQHRFNSMVAEGNINSGDVTYASGKLTFTGYMMSIKGEMAKAIDDYFTMYGYKVNSLKIPNITGRTNWNYVKTIGANIEGNIPENDINELKSLFNNGITLWHKTNYYLDYSQSNNIV